MGSTFTVCVGIGLNLDNEIPYPGVNKLVKNSKVCREELMAEIFYNLENLIPQLKNGNWRDEYYAHWVHNDEKGKFLKSKATFNRDHMFILIFKLFCKT